MPGASQLDPSRRQRPTGGSVTRQVSTRSSAPPAEDQLTRAGGIAENLLPGAGRLAPT